jgi:hypothetical protein
MLSLGTYPDTSLADARKEREKARQDLANDINPSDARRNANLPERLFEAVARHWLRKLAKKVGLQGPRGLLQCLHRPLAQSHARPKELRQAERSAFDLEAGEWRVARTIMKMKVEHVIPLSRQDGIVMILDRSFPCRLRVAQLCETCNCSLGPSVRNRTYESRGRCRPCCPLLPILPAARWKPRRMQ